MAFIHAELSTPTASTQHTRNFFLLHSNKFPLIVPTHQQIYKNQLRVMTMMMTLMTYLERKIIPQNLLIAMTRMTTLITYLQVMMIPQVEL